MTDAATPAGRPAVGRIRSDQDHNDLLTYHLSVIREAQAAVETAKGPLTAARAKVSEKQEDETKAFNAAKADLGRGYTREYMNGLLVDGRKKITELVEFEKMRARDKVAISQPVFGQQSELFPGEETPVEAKDELSWEAEGWLRGRRGDLEELQDRDPPRFHQAIMRGYEKGQAETAAAVQRAMELRQAEADVDANAEVKDLNAGSAPEPGTPEAAAEERKAVERAKESLGVTDKPKAQVGGGRRRAGAPEPAIAGVH